uniref:ATP synthase subunit a n=1 Tax=Grandidierella rubroantennata TaxID=2614733 RepID=A0A5H2XW35_9CRUS|nr:ATP synthase F0 subunit 6 [Grandidierella rubroantennata]
MTNLFNIFDPSTSLYFSMNWISALMILSLCPILYWKLPNRMTKTFTMLFNYIFSEFKPLMNKLPNSLSLILAFFTFIMLNNIMGLMPYVFTATSHMSTTMMMALSLWIGMMLHGWIFNTSNLLIHLAPKGTPALLMPFMVLIETISNIIRPLTLSIRLAANMIAGHLLITLLTSVTPFTPMSILPILLSAQFSLNILELAVAFIQAYVFSVLITLYASESIS